MSVDTEDWFTSLSCCERSSPRCISDISYIDVCICDLEDGSHRETHMMYQTLQHRAVKVSGQSRICMVSY